MYTNSCTFVPATDVFSVLGRSVLDKKNRGTRCFISYITHVPVFISIMPRNDPKPRPTSSDDVQIERLAISHLHT